MTGPFAAKDASHLIEGIGRTPLVDIALCIHGTWRGVGLKLESHNPAGSIKDRTAYALVRSLESAGRIGHGCRLVESTSGNLGVALALISKARGYSFTAVVDPKVDPVVVDRMRSLGAELVPVSEPDPTGGYLLTRLAQVQQLVAEHRMVWPNQYENPANPAIHYHDTAPELRRQRPDIDAVFVAASTGGTLAGIGRYFRTVRSRVQVVAVDVPGSRVFDSVPAPRLLNGIGSSRPSSFLRRGDYDDVIIVSDREAIATCHAVQASVGIGLGGSSGASVAACARYLAGHPEIRRAVCICPDGLSNYVNTIYSAGWLSEHTFTPARDAAALPFTDVVEERFPNLTSPVGGS
jgi:2,3-diaminopropionate biosynthesis protein SbnA